MQIMASPPPPDDAAPVQAQVILSSPDVLSEPDERLLLDVLSDCGADPRLFVELRRGDTTTLTWIVLASLPLQAFLTALGSKAAEDSYAKLRALVRRLASTRRARGPASAAGQEAAPSAGRETPAGSPAPLILMDSGTGLQIVLEADLPADAYRELVAMDLSRFRFGPLHYDGTRHRWRSELDEAAAGPQRDQ
jgi:hypothetical protein